MKALKCDFCGGSLVIDDSREFATCEFCGTKYMASTLRAKIQEIRGTVKIEGAVETVTGNAEKERLIKNAETYTDIKEYAKAADVYSQIALQFPDDYRGWWGVFTSSVEIYFSGGKFLMRENNAVLTSYKLCSDRASLDAYINSIIGRYGKTLRVDFNHNNSFFAFSTKAKRPPVLDSFTYWIIFKSANQMLPKVFTDFAAELSLQFRESINNGSVFFLNEHSFLPYINETLCVNIPANTLQKTAYLISKICSLTFLQETASSQSGSHVIGFSFTLGGNTVKFRKILKVYGCWAIVEDLQGVVVSVRLPKTITQKDFFKSLNLCQHCGGKLKGVLKPTCTQCGKQKDY